MNCELCASPASCEGTVEGARLLLCESCSRFSKNTVPVKKPEPEKIKAVEKPKPAKVLRVVKDFKEKIKKARLSLGLSQTDFAKRLAEKESTIKKLEIGVEPSIETAKKLEAALGVKLLEEVEEEKIELPKVKGEALTIGDLISTRQTSKPLPQRKKSG